MANHGVNRSDVQRAVLALEHQGRVPTPTNVRLELGRGSYTTILRLLPEVRAGLARKREVPPLPDALSGLGADVLEDVWRAAMDEASKRVGELQREHQEEMMALQRKVDEAQEQLDRLRFETGCLQHAVKERESALDSLCREMNKAHGTVRRLRYALDVEAGWRQHYETQLASLGQRVTNETTALETNRAPVEAPSPGAAGPLRLVSAA